jgi:rRNA-processing protein FCF1
MRGGERPQPLIRECVSDHLDDLSRALEWKAEINRQMEQAAMAERERRAVEFREK